MAKLDEEARMTIQTLARKGLSNRETARLLGAIEGAVRHQLRRMEAGTPDGRSRRSGRADAYAEAIDAWREAHGDGAVNLAALHEWLVCEHNYPGSLRSVQRYWKKSYPPLKLRARRRVETPPGVQSQVDWAHFPGVVLGGRRTDLLAFRLVLSHSRYQNPSSLPKTRCTSGSGLAGVASTEGATTPCGATNSSARVRRSR